MFTFFGQFESTKLNFIRKVWDEKVRNFSPTKISSFTVITFSVVFFCCSMSKLVKICPPKIVVYTMFSKAVIFLPKVLRPRTQVHRFGHSLNALDDVSCAISIPVFFSFGFSAILILKYFFRGRFFEAPRLFLDASFISSRKITGRL